MSQNILEKANTKLKEIIEGPSIDLPKLLGLLFTLKTCYPKELNNITQEIQILIKEQKNTHQNILNELTKLTLSSDSFKINQRNYSLLKISEIRELFTGYPYEFIKIAYCLIPENLLLLSLRGTHEKS